MKIPDGYFGREQHCKHWSIFSGDGCLYPVGRQCWPSSFHRCHDHSGFDIREVLPKSYAKSHAEKLALSVASALSAFTIIMTPFVKIFDVLSRALKPKTEAPSVTEDELKYIIDEIEEEGVLEEQESDLVLSALQFDETTVNDILIPRVKIVGVSSEATTDEICEMFLHSHFSRFPVYEKSMDNIIGMITSRDFFRLSMACSILFLKSCRMSFIFRQQKPSATA